MSQTPWRILGGPLGRHTSAAVGSVSGWARLAVLLAALPVLAALALRSWCLTNGFAGQGPLWRACYSDLPSALLAAKTEAALADPVVRAIAVRAVAALVPGTGAGSQSGYVVLWAGVSLVGVAIMAAAIAAYRSNTPDRALLLVLCPALPFVLLISADILGVTLAVMGLLAWRRRLDAAAGVLIALSVFSRGYALILVVVVVASALQSARDVRRFLVGLAGGTLGILALGATLGVSTLTEPLRRWWETAPSYGSMWMIPGAAGSPIPAGLTPWIALGGWVVAVVLVVAVTRVASHPPDVADLALLGVAVVLLTSTAVPVQASLWLVPLVALSSLPWRDMLIWAGAEVLYYPMVWLYIAGLENPDRALPVGWYVTFLLLRLAGIGYLAFRVVDRSLASPDATDPSPTSPSHTSPTFLSPSEKGLVDHASVASPRRPFSPQPGKADPGQPGRADPGRGTPDPG